MSISITVVGLDKPIHRLEKGDIQIQVSHAKLACPICGEVSIVNFERWYSPRWLVTSSDPLSISPPFEMQCCGVIFSVDDGKFVFKPGGAGSIHLQPSKAKVKEDSDVSETA